ncbi:hillarin isoform X2 [Patella vulgata]|uniref:hillarin isoform X2 n=1 Tax=Patella vulgata TaxID=6465 RepID=UPI00218080B8|nr:hillarin isoform X2 [Patella vulgata]
MMSKNDGRVVTCTGMFYLSNATQAMNLGGNQGYNQDDDLPPPPPELLQQQYLYGALPDGSGQAVMNNLAFTQGKGQPTTYAPGTGEAVSVQQQKANIANIPATSSPYKVEKRSVGQQPPAVPSNFQLVPVRNEKSSTPPPVPASSSQVKPNLDAIDKQVLKSVDDHAIQVSKSDHNSFRDLVWDLIYSKNITNEIEKVRVIFRWLATKNLKEMNFDHIQAGSPEEVLMGLKTGKTTYAMVFDTMCNYAGLHSKIISGYAKGADYHPGMKFQPGSNQHSWNAVYIYGTWCLIDAHWAARRIIGKQAQTNVSEEFHYQLDEYFFLPDPHQLIYTHFPDENKWQLLEIPITLEEFENLPHMKPQFFKYQLEFVTHRTAVIYSRGEINIRLRYSAQKLAVTFNFTICFENGEEEYRGVKLNRYGMQESVGSIASFRLRLPIKGSYILYIYAKEDTPENKENVYAQVCEYKIVQEDSANPAPEPFPPCSYLNWGPGPSFNRYGLTTYQQTACIFTRDGKAEVQIKIPHQMQFMGKVKSNHHSDGDLEGYVVHRVVGNTAFFNVTAPQRGEYGLEIYANDPVKEGTTLYHVAQYVIVCNEDVKTTPLPKLPPGYLGPQSKFTEFGLSTASHHDPIIHLDTNTVTIQIRSEAPLRVTGNLLAVQDDSSEVEHPEFIFAHTMGSLITFIVNLPHTGFYKLQLYACPVNDSSQQLPGVYNYLINCREVKQAVFPFPKQYAQWKEGCFMYEPGVIASTTGPNGQKISRDRLPPQVNFRLMIPKADAVAVVAGDDWTHLEKLQGNEWGGVIDVEKHYGKNTKITVNANYGGDKTSYATLLEYTV